MADSDLRILYNGARISLDSIPREAFTRYNNKGNPQLLANQRTKDIKKRGCLAGSVIAQRGNGLVGPAMKDDDAIVGLLVVDAVWDPYDTIGLMGSRKATYVCCMGIYETNIYETADVNGADIMPYYEIGANLFSSMNGFLTVKEGLPCHLPSLYGIIIGVVTKVPTKEDPWLRFNLRI